MPTALLSVSDKTGLADFARRLAALGWKLLASGGTARQLRDAGLEVREVSAYTGSPEILDGRVKTLHPGVHGGILARDNEADRAQLAAAGWEYIDLVAVNLYPFERTVARPETSLAEAIEEIDIGGVALIRAAAKNHVRVTVVCDPEDYESIANELERGGRTGDATRKVLARKGFALCSAYDAAIAEYLDEKPSLKVRAFDALPLRYGENPHQAAEFYPSRPGGGPLGAAVLQGKELSYNNILDLDAAWKAVEGFKECAVAVVKHLSPCGIAEGPSLEAATLAAIASDPVSAFGGVLAFNRIVDEQAVAALGELFVEGIAAPGFSPEALAALARRKNARLVRIAPDGGAEARTLRSVRGGYLVQDEDRGDPEDSAWTQVSRRAPSAAEMDALRFAWKAVAHVRSNAIVLARGHATVGIGGGQPNRVDSVRTAIQRAGEKAPGSVLASDAFFPFPDSVELAAQAGITAIVHPGGSLRDSLSVAAADAAGIAMMTTGVRHFRH